MEGLSQRVKQIGSFFFKEYLPLIFVFCLYFKYLFIGCIRSLLRCRNLSLVAYGLSCPIACGTVVPRPEIEPASPALENGFLSTGPPGKAHRLVLQEAVSQGGVLLLWGAVHLDVTIFFFFWPCHVACGILVPQPGVESGSSAVKASSPNHWTSGEFLDAVIFVEQFGII